MAVIQKSGRFSLLFRPFREKQIKLRVDAMTKSEAKIIEAMILRACRTGDYSLLDALSKEACIRMFENQGWELPPGLGCGSTRPSEELTLWRAAQLFLTYPGVRNAKARPRYEICLVHLVEHFGKNCPVWAVDVPAIREYQVTRTTRGASASTVNWEKATLSRIFGVLIELGHGQVNPARQVKNLSQKGGERQAYLSRDLAERIAATTPEWFRFIVWTSYYSGLRRGEILGLTRKRVNLNKRMIYLGPEHTKEGHWKRVPIHRQLVPILEGAMKVTSLESDQVFLIRDSKGIRPAQMEASKNPWGRACEKLVLEKPWPRFHDLRHTWRANARRSGMDPFIAESILGHWFRGRSVNERYGFVSNDELIRAIDQMTFDHGETEIFVGKML
jgi:integrase